MLVGIISGTYSTVFIAAAIVTFWRRRSPARGAGRRPPPRSRRSPQPARPERRPAEARGSPEARRPVTRARRRAARRHPGAHRIPAGFEFGAPDPGPRGLRLGRGRLRAGVRRRPATSARSAAVLAYFRRDVAGDGGGAPGRSSRAGATEPAQTACALLVAGTVPGRSSSGCCSATPSSGGCARRSSPRRSSPLVRAGLPRRRARGPRGDAWQSSLGAGRGVRDRLRAGGGAGARRVAIGRRPSRLAMFWACGATRRRDSPSCSAYRRSSRRRRTRESTSSRRASARASARLFAVGHDRVGRGGVLDRQVLHPVPRRTTRSTCSRGTGWRCRGRCPLVDVVNAVQRVSRVDPMLQWLRRSFITGFFVTVPLIISVAALVWASG